MATPHVSDIGTQIRVTLTDENGDPVNVSSATEMVIIIQDPEGVSVEKEAGFYTDGTEGVIVYAIEETDFAVAGKYKIQARVVLPTGTWWSTIGSFKVADNLIEA